MTTTAYPGWHPSYGEAAAVLDCPVCGAAAGTYCGFDPDGEPDIHIDRILLARGLDAGPDSGGS